MYIRACNRLLDSRSYRTNRSLSVYFYTSNNLVMVHIRNIRRKLGDDPQNSRTIRTVWGKGYRIE